MPKMKPLHTIIILCTMLHALAVSAYASRTTSYTQSAAARLETVAERTAPSGSDAVSADSAAGRHKNIETYVMSDDEGRTLVIRVRFSSLLNIIILASAAAVVAIIVRHRRRTALQRAGGSAVPHPAQVRGAEYASRDSASVADDRAAAVGAKIVTESEAAIAAVAEPVSNSSLLAVSEVAGASQPVDDEVTAPSTSSESDEAAGSGVPAPSGSDRKMLQRLDEFIVQHISEVDLSVNDLATAVYMSRSNLFRRLRALYGITPNEYLRQKRLVHAAELLRDGRYNISDICFMVGFSSPSYFASCFKKQFGTLPKNYKVE